MSAEQRVREMLDDLSLDDLVRIDAGLEGDWSDTVVTIWTRQDGLIGFGSCPASHSEHFPSVELIFPAHWLGMRCYVRHAGLNELDERMAMTVIELVERRLAS